MLRVGFVTGSDQEHDVGGVGAPPASPTFGERHAQLRRIGAAFYISHPDRDQSSSTMATDPLSISQP
ncbi:MAG TPA: hypothetical protein VJ777_08665, partial [Mycobacterium sp.]|nr:hypothetical protein [Mycobacterium sp.]